MKAVSLRLCRGKYSAMHAPAASELAFKIYDHWETSALKLQMFNVHLYDPTHWLTDPACSLLQTIGTLPFRDTTDAA